MSESIPFNPPTIRTPAAQSLELLTRIAALEAEVERLRVQGFAIEIRFNAVTGRAEIRGPQSAI